MTSEKTEVTYPSPKKTKFEQLRADHELFLQAFESKSGAFREPTEIYTHCPSFDSVEWKRSLTCYFPIIPLSEPTQIYRFLRTRNAVAVSRFLDLFKSSNSESASEFVVYSSRRHRSSAQ